MRASGTSAGARDRRGEQRARVAVGLIVATICLASPAFCAASVIDWQATYRGDGQAGGAAVRQTADGGFVVTGWTNAASSGERPGGVYVVKTDRRGFVAPDTPTASWEQILQRTPEWVGRAGGTSVQQTADGGYIVG